MNLIDRVIFKIFIFFLALLFNFNMEIIDILTHYAYLFISIAQLL
jgi:hypothetical protein